MILRMRAVKKTVFYIQVTDEDAIHKTVCPIVTDCKTSEMERQINEIRRIRL